MGRRLQTRRDALEARALFALTVSYLAVFAIVVAVLSIVAYAFVERNYASIVGPALETPEGRAGFAAAMRPALYTILAFDGCLLLVVGVASNRLARAALRPLAIAREREERFAADVAHELRTPLAAIASIAQTADAGADAPAARTAFAAIARRALDCGTLVGDLLTLARGNDATSLDREPVDLALVVREAVRDIEAEDSRAPSFEVSTVSGIVDGDERRLAQLAKNLLANARTHALLRVSVSVERRGNDIVLEVSDDGPGVEPQVLPRLFERFVKGSASHGSGLGLAIARWVAGAHGGDLTYAGGSTFVARIPASVADREPPFETRLLDN